MLSFLCFLVLSILACEAQGAQAPARPGSGHAAVKARPAQAWPRPIPARIRDGKNKDLFVMTLGEVESPLADGVFDPVRDEMTLKDGSVIKNYYRDTLGIRYYRPIDKSRFPLPPSGLCTWYYYYQDINETEVKRNAEWIAKNLKDYGAHYVQIDDAYSGTGSFTFAVVGDGQELASSGALQIAAGLKPLEANIAGVKRLVLRVTISGETGPAPGRGRGPGGRGGGQGGWLNARVTGLAGGGDRR